MTTFRGFQSFNYYVDRAKSLKVNISTPNYSVLARNERTRRRKLGNKKSLIDLKTEPAGFTLCLETDDQRAEIRMNEDDAIHLSEWIESYIDYCNAVRSSRLGR